MDALRSIRRYAESMPHASVTAEGDDTVTVRAVCHREQLSIVLSCRVLCITPERNSLFEYACARHWSGGNRANPPKIRASSVSLHAPTDVVPCVLRCGSCAPQFVNKEDTAAMAAGRASRKGKGGSKRR